MPSVTTCPDPQELANSLLGQLPGPEAEALKLHLQNCWRCLATVQTLMERGQLPPGRCPTVAVAATPRPEQEPPARDGPGGPRAPSKDTTVRQPTGRRAAGHTPILDLGLEPLPAPVPPAASAPGRPFSFLAPPREPDEIARLGPYRLLKVLGTGGMGIVFGAEDLQLKRPVALKVMKPEFRTNSEARQRFLREARAVAGIDHDHIVTVFQVGEDCGLPYLAMQLLRGETLEARLERQRQLPVAEAVRIGREIADGLAAAHERGLIHRDIKPPNIWLEGERGRVKILDFGLARASDDLHLTRTGTVMGTPEYMSPEQASGKPVDARSDLFSLGCVLYDMCAGQSPFQAKKTMMVLLALATKAPRSLTDLNPAVSQPLADLIMQLLDKQPDDRPPSSKAVVEALRRIESGAVPQRVRARRPTTRPDPWGRWVVAALVLTAVGIGSFFFGADLIRAVKGALAGNRAEAGKPR